MGRPSKNGRFVNFLINKELLEKFDAVVGIVGKTKTGVLEDILKEYVERFYDANGKIHSRKAVYLKTGYYCQVLDEITVNDKKFYKIFYDGDILNVPAGDIVI